MGLVAVAKGQQILKGKRCHRDRNAGIPSKPASMQLKKITDLVILTNLNSLLGDKKISEEGKGKKLNKENKVKFGQDRG